MFGLKENQILNGFDKGYNYLQHSFYQKL